MMMKERKKETQNSYEEENFITETNKNNIFNKFQNNQQIYK